MLDQTISFADFPRLLILIFLEGVLSMDNAIALGLIARSLPQEKRKKALFIGLFSSILLRTLGILSIAYFIHLFWVQWIGGAYLLYLSFAYFYRQRKKTMSPAKKRSFFGAILLIEVTDLLFALDSILAGLALIGITSFHSPHLPSKLWIVYVGAVLGLIGMRFTAHFFTRFLDRFPKMEKGAHLMIGWIGLKLGVEGTLHEYAPLFLSKWATLFSFLFWLGLALFFSVGLIKKNQSP